MLSINEQGLFSDVPENQDLNPDKPEERIMRARHSCAHIMAQAVVERFADAGIVKLGVGPAITDGFYYDFDLPRPLQEDDLVWIEERMKQIVRKAADFKQSTVSAKSARELFSAQVYKLELIGLIENGLADDNGNLSAANHDSVNSGAEGSFQPNEIAYDCPVSLYQHDKFVDLCKGPHVANTIEINPDGLKILHSTGSHWRGIEQNPIMTRIYGTLFPSKEELDQHLHRLEEIKRRDHRRIGKKLELFHFDDTAKGMPYWLPNGMRMLNELLAFWRDAHEKRGYDEISSPILNDKKLWEISGHWEHYQENMFVVELGDDTEYGLKPMNCPNAMVVFGLKLRSYRDLPMRLADCDILHRHERSGTLNGLFRVQKFQQDDAHIFVAPHQIEQEFDNILDLAQEFYSVFDLSFSFRLSLRPDDFMGESSTWDEAEAALKRILDKRVGEGNYLVAEKEGAFYGPKIDILMKDSLGRKWQMGTIQLDFQLPARFGLTYVDSDGSKKTPVVIHRVIYGSIDRFIGVLLEHTAGDLPLWLAPVQVAIVPIADRHVAYAELVGEKLRAQRLRFKIDSGAARMNRKIRDWELVKVPYIVVIGDRELERSSLSVRTRDSENHGELSTDEFIQHMNAIVKNRSNHL